MCFKPVGWRDGRMAAEWSGTSVNVTSVEVCGQDAATGGGAGWGQLERQLRRVSNDADGR